MVIYISHAFVSHILPKCSKTREPKDEHCVSLCTSIYMTHAPQTILRLTHIPSTAIHKH